MWLQFAADAEWPHPEPANHPIRREFQLPATRPFIGQAEWIGNVGLDRRLPDSHSLPQ